MRERQFTDCVDIVGTSCKPFEGNRRYISTGAVATDHIDESDVEIVDYKSRPSRADLVVEPGTLLFAKMQGTKKTLCVDKEKAENIYSTGFFALKAKSGVISTRCLYHLLESTSFLTQKDKNCSGATQKAITNAGLKKIRVSIPDYQLQEAIADQLDKISSVIQMRRSELQKLDDLVKARFVEMFGDPKSNPHEYEKPQLKETCKVITGNTPSRAIREYYGDCLEWIKTDNIVSGVLNPTAAVEKLSRSGVDVGRTVDAGTILMACIAGSIASIGRVCVTDRKVAFNQQINAIVPQKYNVLFLYTLLQISKDYLVEEINLALKGILSKSKLEEKHFILPPMESQDEFASFVEQVDKSKFVESIHVLKLIKEAIAKEVSHDRIR